MWLGYIRAKLIKRFTLLRIEDVISMSDKDILGEWSDNIKAFWFGANDCEWVAWKGSHQVFVYPCDKYPQPPFQVIQHTKRIETLRDFTEAINTGIVYEPSYPRVKAYWQS